MFTVTLTLFSYGNIRPEKNCSKKDSVVFYYLDSIKYLLDSLHVEEPKYVMAQALWETGNFRCKSCAWQNNNMFGFRGQSGKYMSFNTWRESVIYYANWQKKRYPKYKSNHPNGTYLDFLTWCKYAVSPDYAKNITKMYRWIQNNWSEG